MKSRTFIPLVLALLLITFTACLSFEGKKAMQVDAGHDETANDITRDAVDAGRDGSGDCNASGECSDSEHECNETRPCREGFECRSNTCVLVSPTRVPTGVFQSNGGGQASSASHKLRWTIGMPQPFGKGSSSGHRLTAGPGAGRP